ADEPSPLLLATVHTQLGGVRLDQGRLKEAEDHFNRATDIRRALPGPQPDVDDQLHRIMGSLANVRREQQRNGEAEQLLRDVLAWSIQRYRPRDPKVADYLHNLGGVLADHDDLGGAEKYYRESLDILRAAYGDGHPALAT